MSIATETLFSENETANSKQLAILKKNFPQCFDKNGGFISFKMEEILKSNSVDVVKEFYSLNWLGKSYARLLTNIPSQQLIKGNIEHNCLEKNKNSKNILIKGDNLEVLKHLTNAYRESVKMIYIDPPYNTGNMDFSYKDDFKFTLEQLVELAGVDKEEAERILEFTEKGSNSHSAWLTFVYPRLYIARELLSDDGVIFISIDDNEQAQLRLLCDDIFGEENFISQIAVVNNPKGRSDQDNIATAHESLLVYKKSSKTTLKGFEAKEHIKKRYNKNIEGKLWREIDLRKTGDKDRKVDREKMYYPFYWNDDEKILSLEKFEGSIEIFPMKSEQEMGRWRWGFSTAKKDIEHLFARYMPIKKQWSVFEKDYFDENDLIKSTSVWDSKDVNSERGTEAFIKHLGFPKSVFPNPKPIGTINRALQLGSNEDSIILDFFSGSGTTAHAVMKLNSEDNGNRRFICVQLDELTYEIDANTGKRIAKKGAEEAFNAGYDSIFDITKQRIERAAAKIQEDNPSYEGDLGFRIYETTNDFRVKIDDAFDLNNTSLFDDVQLTDEQYQSLLTTWLLYDANKLTEFANDIVLGDYTAHLCKNRLYLISPNFTIDNVAALLEKLDSDKDFAPNKIVIYGSNFDSSNQMELNEALKSYGNKKSIDISLLVRY